MYTAFIRALIIAYLIPSKCVHLFHLEYFLMGFLYVYIIKISSRDIYKDRGLLNTIIQSVLRYFCVAVS